MVVIVALLKINYGLWIDQISCSLGGGNFSSTLTSVLSIVRTILVLVFSLWSAAFCVIINHNTSYFVSTKKFEQLSPIMVIPVCRGPSQTPVIRATDKCSFKERNVSSITFHGRCVVSLDCSSDSWMTQRTDLIMFILQHQLFCKVTSNIIIIFVFSLFSGF